MLFIIGSIGVNNVLYSKVIGEGNQKIVVIDDDELFNEGMIFYWIFKGNFCYCCIFGCVNYICIIRV